MNELNKIKLVNVLTFTLTKKEPIYDARIDGFFCFAVHDNDGASPSAATSPSPKDTRRQLTKVAGEQLNWVYRTKATVRSWCQNSTNYLYLSTPLPFSTLYGNDGTFRNSGMSGDDINHRYSCPPIAIIQGDRVTRACDQRKDQLSISTTNRSAGVLHGEANNSSRL